MALAQRSHECVGSLIIVRAFERVCLVPSSAIDDMCSSPNVIIIIITIERNACVTMHKISKKDSVIKGPVCRIQCHLAATLQTETSRTVFVSLVSTTNAK